MWSSYMPAHDNDDTHNYGYYLYRFPANLFLLSITNYLQLQR